MEQEKKLTQARIDTFVKAIANLQARLEVEREKLALLEASSQ